MRDDTLIPASVDDIRLVANSLSEVGVCVLCVLRFLGVRRPAPYASTLSAQKCIDDSCSRDGETCEPVLKRKKLTNCVTCLGILQDLCDTNSICEITKQVKGTEYDADTFLFSLSIPASLSVRQYSMLLHLKHLFPGVYGDKTTNDIPSVKEGWKWALGPIMEEELGMKFQIHGGLNVTINIYYDDNEQECNLLPALDITTSKKKTRAKEKRGWSRSTVEKVLAEVDVDIFKSGYPCPPSVPPKICYYGPLTCVHHSLYIAGRYNKYSRKISQTPWIIDGKKLFENSVQDLICAPISDAVLADAEIIFSSSGREDVDVRTLGRGRPFLLQLVNPRKTKLHPNEVKRMQEKINQSTTDIEVRYLQVVSKEDITKLKEGEEDKVKTYTALCYAVNKIELHSLAKLNNIMELELQQKTPVRVLHRRPAAVRKKVVHLMKAHLVDDHHFNLHLTTQAGTYIKEFVHGDFGRTVPNLCTLLANEVDILELDVQSVELDWPPEI